MEACFWHQMWEQEVQGFHQEEINGFLLNHWQRLQLTGSEKVLVPLCGKSLDMAWLAKQGHDVIGVELSQKAVDAFVAGCDAPIKPIEDNRYSGYELPGITLLCGDFFQLTAEDCKGVKAVYDRAAIVALPEEMRQQYATHLQKILPKGTRYLMVVMDYDQSLMSGPPFAVSEQEVRALFSSFSQIEKVQSISFERKGVMTTEMAFVMTA